MNFIPEGIPLIPFLVWWVMHYLRIFKNSNYGILLIYHERMLIHRAGIFPGYFRFPFMSREDLQIGDIWTHRKYRNRGIALFAIKQILHLKKSPDRKFWYVVEENNLASIRVIEKAGFDKVGEGIRKKKFGLKLLGNFERINTKALKKPSC